MLLLILSLSVFAAGEEGTGSTVDKSHSEETNYKLVCTKAKNADTYCTLIKTNNPKS